MTSPVLPVGSTVRDGEAQSVDPTGPWSDDIAYVPVLDLPWYRDVPIGEVQS